MATISWLIPRLIEGSGGHRTMLQHAHALECTGHICPIYIEGTGDQEQAINAIERLFGYRFSYVSYGWESVKKSDFVLATIWYSAAIVRDLPFSCIKAYFVQDYEAMFNPMGDAYLMAENSYKYGLIPITIGRWLKNRLAGEYKISSCHYDFGADNNIYRPLPESKRERAVCFIYQPDKPRRCSRIGIEALGIVKYHKPDVKIYIYGSHQSEKGNIWFEHEHLGLLGIKECNALYNRCSVGLCLSSSNPSRVPFEMMASGLPVAELWRDNNLYDMPSFSGSLSDPTPESIAENIMLLLDDENRRERMSRSGVDFMANRSLENETAQFRAIVDDLLNNKKPVFEECLPMYDRPPIVAGAHTTCLPYDLRQRLTRPSNAYLNSFPEPVRKLLGWGARKARQYLLK